MQNPDVFYDQDGNLLRRDPGTLLGAHLPHTAAPMDKADA